MLLLSLMAFRIISANELKPLQGGQLDLSPNHIQCDQQYQQQQFNALSQQEEQQKQERQTIGRIQTTINWREVLQHLSYEQGIYRSKHQIQMYKYYQTIQNIRGREKGEQKQQYQLGKKQQGKFIGRSRNKGKDSDEDLNNEISKQKEELYLQGQKLVEQSEEQNNKIIKSGYKLKRIRKSKKCIRQFSKKKKKQNQQQFNENQLEIKNKNSFDLQSSFDNQKETQNMAESNIFKNMPEKIESPSKNNNIITPGQAGLSSNILGSAKGEGKQQQNKRPKRNIKSKNYCQGSSQKQKQVQNQKDKEQNQNYEQILDLGIIDNPFLMKKSTKLQRKPSKNQKILDNIPVKKGRLDKFVQFIGQKVIKLSEYHQQNEQTNLGQNRKQIKRYTYKRRQALTGKQLSCKKRQKTVPQVIKFEKPREKKFIYMKYEDLKRFHPQILKSIYQMYI